MTQEVFPEFELDQVTVRVPYPGASPAEVEQGILLSRSRTSIARRSTASRSVTSEALEGVGTVHDRSSSRAPTATTGVLQDVKNEVDRIITFPEEAEEPVVSIWPTRKRNVMSVLVHGDDARPASLRALAESVRDEL